MPNSPSAKKRLRQSIDRRARNRVVRSTLRTQIKKVRTAIAAGDVAASETEFRTAVEEARPGGRQEHPARQRGRAAEVAPVEGDQGDEDEGDRLVRLDWCDHWKTLVAGRGLLRLRPVSSVLM